MTRSVPYTPSAAPRVALRLGSQAPDFDAATTQGHVNFHKWSAGSWVVLFSHPEDFTPVCTTELGAFAKLSPEFARRNVKLIGLSANHVDAHHAWISDIHEVTGGEVRFPIIGDQNRKIALLYDMIDYRDITNVDARGMVRKPLTQPPRAMRQANLSRQLLTLSILPLGSYNPIRFHHRSIQDYTTDTELSCLHGQKLGGNPSCHRFAAAFGPRKGHNASGLDPREGCHYSSFNIGCGGIRTLAKAAHNQAVLAHDGRTYQG